MYTYTIVLDPDPDHGGYTVSVPALPGCVTEGESVDECLANAQDAIELYLADVVAAGDPIPEERVAPRPLTVTVAA